MLSIKYFVVGYRVHGYYLSTYFWIARIATDEDSNSHFEMLILYYTRKNNI